MHGAGVYRAACAGYRRTDNRRAAAMAKLHATEAAQQVIDAAVARHGGAGVTRGSGRGSCTARSCAAHLRRRQRGSAADIARDLRKEHADEDLQPPDGRGPKAIRMEFREREDGFTAAWSAGMSERISRPTGRPVRAGAAQHARDSRRGRRRSEQCRAHDLYVTDRAEYLAQRDELDRCGSRSWARTPGDGAGRGQRCWSKAPRWSRSRRRRWSPNERIRFVRPRPAAAAGAAAGSASTCPSCTIRAAQRGGRPGRGRRAGCAGDLNAHGRYYAELEGLIRRIAQLLVDAQGMIAGNACCSRGPNGSTPCSPLGSAY